MRGRKAAVEAEVEAKAEVAEDAAASEPTQTAALAVVPPPIITSPKQDLTKPLTSAEKDEALKHWNQYVVWFCKRINDVSKNILRLHWEEGVFLHEAGMDVRKYGDNVIGRYVEDMKKHGVSISESTVYKCISAGEKFTLQEIKEFEAAGITWGQVCNILLNAPTYDARARIVEKIKKGDCENDEELKTEARKINQEAKKEIRAAGKKVSNKGGAHDRVVVRSTTNVCTAVSTKLEEFASVFKNIAKMEDGKLKSELLVAIRDAYRAMDELKKRLTEVEALHDDLIA